MPAEKLGIRDKLLITQKLWRLKTGETTGFIGDLLIPRAIEDGCSRLDYASGRAELRHQANAINLSRYILDKEIGSEDHQRFFEEAYQAELFDSSINNNNWHS